MTRCLIICWLTINIRSDKNLTQINRSFFFINTFCLYSSNKGAFKSTCSWHSKTFTQTVIYINVGHIIFFFKQTHCKSHSVNQHGKHINQKSTFQITDFFFLFYNERVNNGKLFSSKTIWLKTITAFIKNIWSIFLTENRPFLPQHLNKHSINKQAKRNKLHP